MRTPHEDHRTTAPDAANNVPVPVKGLGRLGAPTVMTIVLITCPRPCSVPSPATSISTRTCPPPRSDCLIDRILAVNSPNTLPSGIPHLLAPLSSPLMRSLE